METVIEPTLVHLTCTKCGKDFEYKDKFSGRFLPTYCDGCHEFLRQERVKRKRDEERQERKERFLQLCPPLYSGTQLSKLPADAVRIAQQLKGWTYGPRGLLLAGPSGTGKTRLIWMLICRLMIEHCKSVAIFDWRECLARVMDSERCERWACWLSTADILFIDDLGKCKLTDRIEAELFDLLERRSSRQLPIFFTTNETPETLRARMSPDRGEPFVRRLVEFSEIISLRSDKAANHQEEQHG